MKKTNTVKEATTLVVRAEMSVVGGVYHEVCLRPSYHDVYGSAGRAASALSHLNVPVMLYTYADTDTTELLCERATHEGFGLSIQAASKPIYFDYDQGLAEPKIYGVPENKLPPQIIKDKNILRYGMLEGTAIIDAEYAVYDPQNVLKPEKFGENGSKAENLALVLNRYEAASLSGKKELSTEEQATFLYANKFAQVIIIKQGPAGALICDHGKISSVPAYETQNVFKIGSGDAFAAYFAHAWMIEKASAHDAADRASRATAYYCENNLFPSSEGLKNFNPVAIIPSAAFMSGRRPSVYLAGPFFTLAQLWLVDQARRNLIDLGMKVFSPYHNVGPGVADEVVAKDLEGIRNADIVFAIGDGLDAGTIYEVGFARALGVPVVFYAENETEEDQKMMEGSGCILCSDYVTAIYKTLWAVAKK
ncbi:nucleoside 2-deoxyribosyltransferase [Pectobacterium brasiliense]|nr:MULTISPECIES: PfkB family carbohydrate kinase [Pectobacterium]ARA77889.1 nucleoside 2-deoxyribosyltransferase [Pectobacterium brasiliense]